MATDRKREAVAWRTIVEVGALAKEARTVGLDTVAYLLDMVVLEASQHTDFKRFKPTDT